MAPEQTPGISTVPPSPLFHACLTFLRQGQDLDAAAFLVWLERKWLERKLPSTAKVAGSVVAGAAGVAPAVEEVEVEEVEEVVVEADAEGRTLLHHCILLHSPGEITRALHTLAPAAAEARCFVFVQEFAPLPLLLG
jgi:hypothetical protein